MVLVNIDANVLMYNLMIDMRTNLSNLNKYRWIWIMFEMKWMSKDFALNKGQNSFVHYYIPMVWSKYEYVFVYPFDMEYQYNLTIQKPPHL